MPAAIVGALGVGASIYGSAKQASAQKQAAKAQEKANNEALAYERQQQQRAQRARANQYQQYRQAYQQWLSRYGDKGIDRYGIAPGMSYGPQGTPRAPAGNRPGVTLAGGKQVSGDEYDAYVKAREARRGRSIGELAGVPMRQDIQTMA